MDNKLKRLKEFGGDDFFDLRLPHEFESEPPQRHVSKVRADIPPNFKFNMYWMGNLCGRLAFDAKEGFWSFLSPNAADEDKLNQLSPDELTRYKAQERANEDYILKRLTECESGLEGTRVPYFVESLMPEAWISTSGPDEVFDAECADRYLSNIVIRPNTRKTAIRVDVLEGSLTDPFMIDENHVFQGGFDDIFIPSDEEKSNLRLNRYHAFRNYAALHSAVEVPRMSGVQDKLPAYLNKEGVLGDASANSFTHILKFPVSHNNIKRGLCAVEWFSTLLARKCGLETENFAVSEIPGFGPVFIAERFDIRKGDLDDRAILAEDFCSVLGVRRHAKDEGDVAAAMLKIRNTSTGPDEDLRKIMKVAMFSWLIENDDLHLKNMMLVKEYDRTMSEKLSVRLAPVYDMLCTTVYRKNTKPALTIMGKRDYSLGLFRELGELYGIASAETDEMARELADGILEHTNEMTQTLPAFILNHPHSLSDIEEMLISITQPGSRLESLIKDLSAPRARIGRRA